MLDQALPELFGTETGAKIAAAAMDGDGLTITLHNDVRNSAVIGSGEINIDPLAPPIAMTTEGPQKAPLSVTIGHEAGHAILGYEDNQANDNIEKVENPLRRELNLPERKAYENK